MDVRRILLTGDDGCESLGTRVLIRTLSKKYDLTVLATKTQQSGVGGRIHLDGDIGWDTTEVEGMTAYRVAGSPVDAMEFGQAYFKEPFDLIISGINWGENVSWAIYSSGTFAAAVRGIGVNLAQSAIVLSWKTDDNGSDWFKSHDLEENVDHFLEYPGQKAFELIEEIISEDLYESRIVNVNFPAKKTDKVKQAKVARDITRYYKYPRGVDEKQGVFTLADVPYSSDMEDDLSVDTGALHAGYITVSPIKDLYTL